MAEKVECVLWQNGSWKTTSFLLDYLPKAEHDASATIIFLASEIATRQLNFNSEQISVSQYLSERYDIPARFWTKTAIEASGFFGMREQILSSKSKGVDTFFHFLIKVVLTTSPKGSKILYEWHHLGFFTRWEPLGKATLLCFGLPNELRNRFVLSLLSKGANDTILDPFSLHAVLLSEIVDSYDTSVWLMRDLVRPIEKNRPNTKDSPPEPDYETLHEVARHVVHSSETLEVARNTVACMIRDHEAFSKRNPVAAIDSALFQRTKESLQLDESILKCLHERSKALEERLRNEMTLAFHIVSKYDSAVQVRIGEATQSDSTAMKMISFLGFFFLPGTFLSAVFSTSFFNFTPESDTKPAKWTVSDQFYIYWAAMVPLTTVVMLLGLIWLRFFAKTKFEP